MKYQKIKNVEKPLSKIIFGCAIPVMIQGEDADELLDEVYAQGITTFDTAENYGLSEASLGHWLKNRGNREKVVIISKGCHPYDGRDRVTPENLKHDIEQSFERLGTDYIDIYLMHRDDPKVEPGPMVEILNEYHKAGRIGAFGGSNWTHQRIAEANQYAGEHDIEGAKKILDPNAVKGYCYPENFERLARAEQLAKEKDCTVPQIALAWILNQDFEVFPLVSAKKASRIASNAKALDIVLAKEEVEWLDLRRDRR